MQRYASEAVGRRETFKNTLVWARSLQTTNPDDPGNYRRGRWVLYLPYYYWAKRVYAPVRRRFGNSIVSRVTLFPVRLYRSMLEAVLLVRIKRDSPLDEGRLASKTMKIYTKRFDLDSGYQNYGDLLHLMSSDLERDGPSRALRFQAIRNFQRGMWIACFFAGVLFFLVQFRHLAPGVLVSAAGVVGVRPWTPAVEAYWSPVWTLSACLFGLSYGFWELKEEYEEEFVEYLFTDFVTSHAEAYL